MITSKNQRQVLALLRTGKWKLDRVRRELINAETSEPYCHTLCG